MKSVNSVTMGLNSNIAIVINAMIVTTYSKKIIFIAKNAKSVWLVKKIIYFIATNARDAV